MGKGGVPTSIRNVSSSRRENRPPAGTGGSRWRSHFDLFGASERAAGDFAEPKDGNTGERISKGELG